INTVDYVSQVNPEDLEIARGEVTTVLYAHTRDDVEYVFNDSIATLDTHDGGVDVTFTRGAPRTFDIVVGADGIHSNTRRLVFGEESLFSRYLGYTVAIFTVDGFGSEPQRSTMYNVPGLTAAFGRTTPGGPGQAFLAFRQDDPDALRETDFDGQCDLVARAYRNEGWRIPEIVTAVKFSDRYAGNVVRFLRTAVLGQQAVAQIPVSGSNPDRIVRVLCCSTGSVRDHERQVQTAGPAEHVTPSRLVAR
ncbi:hypothetical protein ACWGCP_09125, partial [Streptomyces niveus]